MSQEKILADLGTLRRGGRVQISLAPAPAAGERYAVIGSLLLTGETREVRPVSLREGVAEYAVDHPGYSRLTLTLTTTQAIEHDLPIDITATVYRANGEVKAADVFQRTLHAGIGHTIANVDLLVV